jgi:NAD(P)-dependent dehydrogenase (short-subunit alcohol dehydrogenase family)
VSDFAGRSAVVTGGGSGMGRAVSIRLAAAGAGVAVWDVNPDAAREVATAIEREGGSARPYQVDVSAPESVREAAARLEAELGPPAALVCCAGTSHRAPLLETPVDDWRRVLAVNLDGPFYCAVEVGRLMARAGGGAIVNIASTSGLTGFTSRPAYIASKTGLVGLTRAAALDLVEHGIRVNAIAPGPIDTPMLRGFLTVDSDSERAMGGRLPMGRLGTVEEIADLVLFLASDRASFITGQVVAIDGGLSISGWRPSQTAAKEKADG